MPHVVGGKSFLSVLLPGDSRLSRLAFHVFRCERPRRRAHEPLRRNSRQPSFFYVSAIRSGLCEVQRHRARALPLMPCPISYLYPMAMLKQIHRATEKLRREVTAHWQPKNPSIFSFPLLLSNQDNSLPFFALVVPVSLLVTPEKLSWVNCLILCLRLPHIPQPVVVL